MDRRGFSEEFFMTGIAVIGPGAIGCAFAAAAMQAGNIISVAARTGFAELDVTYPQGHVRGAVQVLEPASAKPFEIVMLATKAHQTLEAAPWLSALCGPGTVLAVLQNGVEHIERVRPLVGEGVHVVPAMVACPGDRTAAGHAHVTGPARLDIPPGPASERFQRAFAHSFAEVRIVDDWLTSAWSKLVLNAVGGGIGVLTRRGNEVLKDEGVARLYRALAREVVAVGQAEGAKLADDLGDRLWAFMAKGPHLHMGSIVVDRLAGRATEWQARNEVVLRLAAKHGIGVPLNDLVCNLIRAGEPSGS
jgi:2-dehydropantoate 2-reductase